MNKLVEHVIKSDILSIIESHPDLSDTAILSFMIYGGITKETESYV